TRGPAPRHPHPPSEERLNPPILGCAGARKRARKLLRLLSDPVFHRTLHRERIDIRTGLVRGGYARSDASSSLRPITSATRSISTSWESTATPPRKATVTIMQSNSPRGVIPACRHWR